MPLPNARLKSSPHPIARDVYKSPTNFLKILKRKHPNLPGRGLTRIYMGKWAPGQVVLLLLIIHHIRPAPSSVR